jgi:hypothetical protein
MAVLNRRRPIRAAGYTSRVLRDSPHAKRSKDGGEQDRGCSESHGRRVVILRAKGEEDDQIPKISYVQDEKMVSTSSSSV